MKNEDDCYTGEFASERIQKQVEQFIKELREQYSKDPESIYNRPDSILCHQLLSLKDSPPGTKIRLLKPVDATGKYQKTSKNRKK